MASSKVQTLLSFWHEFSLPTLQSKLDDLATEITARQDDSDASRRALIDLMREFKRDQAEDVRGAAAPLVKAFQNEVDALARRSRLAEKAFFEAYKGVTDIVDPAPTLEQAVEAMKGLAKVADMEIEIKQLRETISDYNQEIQEYKTKEKRMQELQSKVEAYDKNIDQTLEVRIKDVTERMLDEYNEKLAAIEEEKSQLRRRNTEQESKLRTMQKQLKEAQDQLFEAMDGSEEKKLAKSDEVEILMEDLEKANARASAAEKETEMLRERLEAAKEEAASDRKDDREGEDSDSSASVTALTRELSAKEREVEHLLADLHTERSEREKEREAAEKEVETMRQGKEESEKTILELRAGLAERADYESIKKDLAIMRSVEFPSEEESEESRPLEVMILERSKALQSENTTLRMDRDRASSELAEARAELKRQSGELERQQGLITELEDHVEKLQELSNRGEAEGRSSADILVDALDQKPGVLVAADPLLSDSPTLGLASDSNSKAALLPIVQAQRERFKQRNEELEEESSRQTQQIQLLQAEVRDLRGDNVKLYEKIRFLQGYQGGGGVSASAHSGSDVAVPVENRYAQQYEQKMDPFASFSQQERSRRYGQLNVFEKVIYSFVRFMMSNKLARLFVFAYSVLLHLLVFLVLMRLAYLDSYRRDLASDWHDRYMRHMEDAHGDGGGGHHDGHQMAEGPAGG